MNKIFNEEELIILANISKQYNYIARDLSNNLFVFKDKPHKGRVSWVGFGGKFVNIKIFDDVFKEIKFEDEEPIRIDDYVNRR